MASFEVGEESLEELEARHSIETAELEVQTAAQLKACKKKERAYYEAHAQQQLYDLQARHRDEIEELEEWVEAGNEVGSSSTAGGEGDGAAAAAAAAAAKQKEAEAALAAAAAAADATANKKAKAQRKKNKALAKAEHEEKVRAEMVQEMGPVARDVELAQLDATLLPLNLQIREIQSDGNCLFRAIADQLNYTGASINDSGSGSSTGDKGYDHTSLRVLAAQHIRSHQDDYEPYLEEGTHFPTYCTRIASSTPVEGAEVLWGGQVEIQALSVCLDKVIYVYSADAPVLRMGGDGGNTTAAAAADGNVLRVSYHAHFFALGAHYNSIVRIAK